MSYFPYNMSDKEENGENIKVAGKLNENAQLVQPPSIRP